MINRITLPYSIMLSLNKVIDLAKTHWSVYAKYRKEVLTALVLLIKSKHLEPVKTYPVRITAKYFCPDKRRDPDNIASSRKFWLDALVKSGILKGDGWNAVSGFIDEFYIDKANPRIEIILDNGE